MTKEEMFIRWQLPQLRGFSEYYVETAQELFFDDLTKLTETELEKEHPQGDYIVCP